MKFKDLRPLFMVLTLIGVITAGTLGGVTYWVPSNALATPTLLVQDAAPAKIFRFVALGDTGTGGKGQFDTANQMARYNDDNPFDTVLLLGDNVYPNGDASELSEKFEKPYAELLHRGVEFYAILGNHDVRRGREAQITYKPFNMGGQRFYSFVKGNGLVEFFALDSNEMDQEQLEWIEGALSRSKARWKIVYLHHPPYSSGMKHGSNTRLRSLLEPVFVRHGVAAVFSGHDHVYERVKPQKGIQYFISGAGGQLRRGNLDPHSNLFLAGDDQVNSFMYVELTPYRFHFRSIGADGRILDEGFLNTSR